PCALLKKVNYGCKYTVDADSCKSCRLCMGIGCPAISFKDGKATIDSTLCVGCGLCETMCNFGAIRKVQ
ncbi:MAG: indolepyruvate ferredoxin oxidoreductase subunit alpha, partial [Ruminococcaceae bacterium]|nr:indolepyruvate ferredoxin oxidoreductase subunit alpha [Oscillospiraceae bacterium]